MQFINIIGATLLASMAIAAPAPVPEPAPSVQAAKTPLIDLWQDAYVYLHLLYPITTLLTSNPPRPTNYLLTLMLAIS